MKVIVASFQCESNSRSTLPPQKGDFECFSGEQIFKKLVVRDIFTENGFMVIPSVYANALPSESTVTPALSAIPSPSAVSIPPSRKSV